MCGDVPLFNPIYGGQHIAFVVALETRYWISCIWRGQNENENDITKVYICLWNRNSEGNFDFRWVSRQFLPEVLDALFGVLAEVGTKGELDDYIYHSIVYILSMEADRYNTQVGISF